MSADKALTKPTKIVKTAQRWNVRWESFTKKQATIALKGAGVDRPTDEAHLWALRESMNLGLWDTYSPAQTPIAFDSDNRRLNGKHRLQAFLQSKLDTIVFPVIRNCHPSAHALFDQNTKARVKAAAHPGRSNVTRDIARVNALVGLVEGMPRTMISGPLFDYYVEHEYKSDILWAAEVFPSGREHLRAAHVTAFMYARRADESFAQEMAEKWRSGDGLTVQLRRMRDEALREAGRGGVTRVAAAELTRRTLNALMLVHRKDSSTRRVTSSLAGLRYFSEKIEDGVADKWAELLERTPTE